MKTFLVIGVVAIAALAYFVPDVLARPLLTRDDINRCAAYIALHEKGGYDGDVAAFLVDNGSHPDFIAKSDGYHRSIGLDTVYTSYVRDGTALALRLKLTFKPMPEYPSEAQLPKGYHITRSNGSASLVKDGEPEPVFGCMDGYHATGSGCAKN